MAKLFTPEIQAFISQRYLAGNVRPSELVIELTRDFGLKVTAAQLRQFLSRRGVSARKRELDEQICSIVSGAQVGKIAEHRAAVPTRVLEAWADSARLAADKAFEAAAQSGRPRELASAVAAASSAVRLFRLCAGIEGPESAPGRAARFDFNFSNMPVNVTPAGAEFATNTGQPVHPATSSLGTSPRAA